MELEKDLKGVGLDFLACCFFRFSEKVISGLLFCWFMRAVAKTESTPFFTGEIVTTCSKRRRC